MKAKASTPNGEGVDNVIEIGGPLKTSQSLEAARLDGIISIIGFLAGGAEQGPSFMNILSRNIIVRGVLVGSGLRFEDMAGGPLEKASRHSANHSRTEPLRPIISSLSLTRRVSSSINSTGMFNI